MIRKCVGVLILRLYPRSVRIERGDEMLGTLLDAGANSATAFVRESASLALAGVRARARASAQLPAARLLADAFRLAAVIWIAVSLAGISALAFAYPAGLGGLELWLLLLWPVLTFSLLGYDRMAGLCGFAWVASVQLPIALGPYPALLAGSLVPLLGFIVMIISPRCRPSDARRLAWLLPTIAVSLIMQPAVFDVGVLGIVSPSHPLRGRHSHAGSRPETPDGISAGVGQHRDDVRGAGGPFRWPDQSTGPAGRKRAGRDAGRQRPRLEASTPAELTPRDTARTALWSPSSHDAATAGLGTGRTEGGAPPAGVGAGHRAGGSSSQARRATRGSRLAVPGSGRGVGVLNGRSGPPPDGLRVAV